ncbi:MAG: hypothetical protein ACOYLB_00365 [Phototrophicaceae bacterium]
MTRHPMEDLARFMAKHLPPSHSKLSVWDTSQVLGRLIQQSRADLHWVTIQPQAEVDAVLFLNPDTPLTTDFVARLASPLRYGGRLIGIIQGGQLNREMVATLESAGLTRILLEYLNDDDPTLGVLLRGEKAWHTASTFKRIQDVAQADADRLTLSTYSGSYLYFPLIQKPNKPIWKLSPDEKLTWEGVAWEGETACRLGFTSLPKAVGFMQWVVMRGLVKDVNKIGKYRRSTVENWQTSLFINPLPEDCLTQTLILLPLNPAEAEQSDE